MTEKKSQHILAIQQVLAEFDIETQVKRITLQTMDAYMLGNKQAFEYIKQWESKFIDFQARLVKAQSYYRNIELSVNSKIEVTNSLNSRLQKFAQQFWATMKETNQSYEQMRKNYMNLVKQSGNQASTLRSLQRELKQTNKRIDKLQTRLQDEAQKTAEHFARTQQQITTKNNERKIQSQNLLHKLVQSKSQFDSKISMLEQLSKDINLYQNQKVSISSQIQNVYDELKNKVEIVQFNKIRVYIDNSVCVNTERIEVVYNELKEQIQVEVQARKCDIKEGIENLTKVHEEQKASFSQIQQKLQKQTSQFNVKIEQLKESTNSKFKQVQLVQKSHLKNIQSLQTMSESVQSRLQQLGSSLEDRTNLIHEIQSNIQSINRLLKDMELENDKRGQELAQLRVDTDDKGDISEQVKKMAEKVLAHDESIRKNGQKILAVEKQSMDQDNAIKEIIDKIDKKFIARIQQIDSQHRKNYEEVDKKYDQKCDKINIKIEQRHQDAIEVLSKAMRQKIDSIKDKFQFLQNLSNDMQIFKKTFQQQLQMNDQLNKEVKQKMDRMFGMFTKLKSDTFMKIQTLGQDQLKSTNKIKESSKILTEICAILTQYNEILNVLLSVSMCNQFMEDRDTPEEYRIASMIQGWVLEVNKERAKYRGEITSKKALIQLCLEQHVKNGDKIKGGILENGKDVFTRMSGGSQDYQQMRRRSISRKKQRQSQLPKVHR